MMAEQIHGKEGSLWQETLERISEERASQMAAHGTPKDLPLYLKARRFFEDAKNAAEGSREELLGDALAEGLITLQEHASLLGTKNEIEETEGLAETPSQREGVYEESSDSEMEGYRKAIDKKLGEDWKEEGEKREGGGKEVELVLSKDYEVITEEVVDEAIKNLPPETEEIVKEKIDGLEEKEKIVQAVQQSLWQRFGKTFTLTTLGAATLRGTLRNAVRWSLGSSLGAGIAAGAVAGGTFEGGRDYLAQRKRVTAENILKQLTAKSSGEEKLKILAKADQAYKEALVVGNEEELRTLAEQLRVTRTFIEIGTEELKDEHIPDKERFLKILELSEKIQKETPKTARRELQALIGDVVFERAALDGKRLARAVGRGALIGAVGGTIGGAVAHWLSEYLPAFAGGVGNEPTSVPGRYDGVVIQKIPGSGLVEEPTPIPKTHDVIPPRGEVLPPQVPTPGGLTEVASPLRPSGAEIIRQFEISKEATEEALSEARRALSAAKFTVIVEKGEGATHVARKLIHDYLVNQNKLGNAADSISKEHLVHAEDTLRRQLEETLQSGQKVSLSGEEIGKTLIGSLKLSDPKVENIAELLKTPEHHLSEKTVSGMTNFGELTNSENNFFETGLENARRASEEALRQLPSAPEKSPFAFPDYTPDAPHPPLMIDTEDATINPEELLRTGIAEEKVVAQAVFEELLQETPKEVLLAQEESLSPVDYWVLGAGFTAGGAILGAEHLYQNYEGGRKEEPSPLKTDGDKRGSGDKETAKEETPKAEKKKIIFEAPKDSLSWGAEERLAEHFWREQPRETRFRVEKVFKKMGEDLAQQYENRKAVFPLEKEVVELSEKERSILRGTLAAFRVYGKEIGYRVGDFEYNDIEKKVSAPVDVISWK